MTINNYHITRHALRRMAQRNLGPADIVLVLRWGRQIYRTGVNFFFLGKRDLPSGRERELERLVGTTVITTHNCIVTAYRNAAEHSRIKRKLKWRLPDPKRV